MIIAISITILAGIYATALLLIGGMRLSAAVSQALLGIVAMLLAAPIPDMAHHIAGRHVGAQVVAAIGLALAVVLVARLLVALARLRPPQRKPQPKRAESPPQEPKRTKRSRVSGYQWQVEAK